jgi:hypothetical protein
VLFSFSRISGDSKVWTEDHSGILPYDFGESDGVLAFGAGVALNRFSVEGRFYLTSNPTPYSRIDFFYDNIGLFVRYQLF